MKVQFFMVLLPWLLLSVCPSLSIHVEDPSPIQGQQVTCNDHEYKPAGKNYCCNKCLQGYKLKADCKEHGQTQCVRCEEDTYMDSPNSSPKCFACSDCLRQNGQIELYPCVKEKDTQCGCQENHYKRGKGTDDSRFECEECSTCLNGTIIRPCSENEDTICLCNPNFFFDKSERMCRHCPVICESPECIDCPKPEGSRKHLETQEVLWIVVSVALVLVFLATTACAVQYFRNKPQSQLFPDITGNIKHQPALMNNTIPENRHLLPGMTAQEVDSPHFSATFSEKVQHVSLPMPDITQRTPQHHSAKAMYAVIECVPFRQWREFVRRLGLSDHLIDTTEQDYRVYKDSQYKMLQAWANLEGSSMDQLYRVLREMNLGGCVERIEERL